MTQYYVYYWIKGQAERREGPFAQDTANRVSKGLARNGWLVRVEKVR